MDVWSEFVHTVRARHGVADVAWAEARGVPAGRFYRRTAREGWAAPTRRVRVHPQAPPSVQRDLLAAIGSTPHLAVAASEAAAWLHGVRSAPPPRPEVMVAYGGRGGRSPHVTFRRCRWLRVEDVTLVDHVPTLGVEPMLLAAADLPPRLLRPRVIDLLFRDQLDPDRLRARAEAVGPLPGKGTLLAMVEELAALRIESTFQDDVATQLEALGYAPDRSTRELRTSLGVPLQVDVALPRWQVAVEPDGDAYHRTREQRRLDRRRVAAYASTSWVPVPVDWRDWHLDRVGVLRAIDAAIAAQRQRGIGAGHAPPDGTRRSAEVAS